MGQTTRHNRHLAERLSPRIMTGEAGCQTRRRIMRAVRIHEFSGIDSMRLDEIPRPVPGA
jgi:hypothetical protein